MNLKYATIFCQENEIKYVVCKMVAILYLPNVFTSHREAVGCSYLSPVAKLDAVFQWFVVVPGGFQSAFRFWLILSAILRPYFLYEAAYLDLKCAGFA